MEGRHDGWCLPQVKPPGRTARECAPFLSQFHRCPSAKKFFHLPPVRGQHQPLDISVKMAKTFHPFNKLPPEIRHKIWEAAVRPFDVLGVQFFSLQFQDTSDSSAGLQIEDDIPVPALSRVQSAVLASPRGIDGLRLNWWNHRDASSHLVDGGLWTACRESNSIIGRLYRTCQPEVWVSELSLSGHKQVRCIHPQLDLICLASISNLACPETHEGPSQILGIDIRRTRSRLNIALDLCNMDVLLQDETKRARNWLRLEQYIKGLVDSFRALPPLKMWIIDRRILMAKASDGGEVFEGHQHLRFVQIFTPTMTAGPDQIMDRQVTGEWALSRARIINEARWRHAVTAGGQSVTVGPTIGVLAVEERK